METEDKARFIQIMLGMADNFRDNITKEGMTMRFDMLKDYKIGQVESAAKQIMLTRKYTKMPPVAEFIEILQGGNKEDKALVIANEIIAHLRTHGSGVFPKLDDKIAKHLMTKRWPYYEWSSMVLESELKWWTKEFCEAYKSYTALEEPMKIATPENVKKLINSIG
ncbi:hypothetical protein KAX02_02885 [candidate division WOR-3 bacterium]|nr:hypothetical protein [candidate division WOR-3 bacterium]